MIIRFEHEPYVALIGNDNTALELEIDDNFSKL